METELSPSSAVNVDSILRDLDAASTHLPKQAITQARQHRDLMVPRLIEVIEAATREAREARTPEGWPAVVAIYLLAEFRAGEALPAILAAISLPDEGPFDLFGDCVTEDLARVLISVASDPAGAFDALIDDRQVNQYVRWQAADGYLYLVRDGRISRDEAVQRLRRHLRTSIDRNDDNVAGPLISVLDSLWPSDAMAEIREAFDRDLVDTSMIDLGGVEETLAKGIDSAQRYLNWLPPSTIDDTIELLHDWEVDIDSAAMPEHKLEQGTSTLPGFLPPPPQPIRRTSWIGRNDPCPCGSGKKFKKCCGSRASGSDRLPPSPR